MSGKDCAVIVLPLATGEVGDFYGGAAIAGRSIGELHEAAPQYRVVYVHIERKPVAQAVYEAAVHSIVYPTTATKFLATLFVLCNEGVAVLFHNLEACIACDGGVAVGGEDKVWQRVFLCKAFGATHKEGTAVGAWQGYAVLNNYCFSLFGSYYRAVHIALQGAVGYVFR